MTIDLRSDTVTKATPAMLEAMMQAKVGDDVYNEDPTVAELEQKTAAIFGMEAGLFCPSGTMTNQIAIRISTQPQHEVVCDKKSHIYNYEGGGIASNSLASVRLMEGPRGRFTAEDVRDGIQPDDLHYPVSAMVAIENTVNKGGGCCYAWTEIEAISAVCKENNLYYHLDGARIFNALVAKPEDARKYGQHFDTISVCLSKGLGAPVGSVLLASRKRILQAKRVRKVFGGGMRQAGYLAAAGIYALDNHVERLKEDHQRAAELGKILSQLPFVEEVVPVETNIVIFSLKDKVAAQKLIAFLESQQIKASLFGKKEIRFVTHLDFGDDMLEKVLRVLKDFKI